jgi:hypothetical protein
VHLPNLLQPLNPSHSTSPILKYHPLTVAAIIAEVRIHAIVKKKDIVATKPTIQTPHSTIIIALLGLHLHNIITGTDSRNQISYPLPLRPPLVIEIEIETATAAVIEM